LLFTKRRGGLVHCWKAAVLGTADPQKYNKILKIIR
jgi:hypothetical protein